jgi:hypothetical protein
MRRSACVLALLAAFSSGCASTVILYSRHDAAEAHRALRLARVYGPAHIDVSIRPGDAWRPAMSSAICGGGTVLVLWSARAAASAEVGGELETARGCGAVVVPLLLDSTALPAGLAGVQAVDWR